MVELCHDLHNSPIGLRRPKATKVYRTSRYLKHKTMWARLNNDAIDCSRPTKEDEDADMLILNAIFVFDAEGADRWCDRDPPLH